MRTRRFKIANFHRFFFLVQSLRSINNANSQQPVPGLPIRDCARGCTNRGQSRPLVSSIDATSKIFFERLYLVQGLGTFGPWVNCPCAPTTPTVQFTTISRFPCNCFHQMVIFWSLRFTSNGVCKVSWLSLVRARANITTIQMESQSQQTRDKRRHWR